MKDRDCFIGASSNMYNSLKVKGFVCRNEKSDQYYVVYKHNDEYYDEGFLHESEIEEFLNPSKSYLSEYQIYEFFGKNNIDNDSFMKLGFVDKLELLFSSFPAEEIMGKSTQNLTFEEALAIVENE
jgi:hypothetical protein